MEIVLIRHGQPDWGSGVNAYTANPELTDLGRIQSEKSSAVFNKVVLMNFGYLLLHEHKNA